MFNDSKMWGYGGVADVPMLLFSKFKTFCGSKPKLFTEAF